MAGRGLESKLLIADRRACPEGINTEVIDLATLEPYDEETVLASMAKTGAA